MFQVLTTIFFSVAIAASLGVMAAMVSDHLVEIRAALRLGNDEVRRTPRHRARRTARVTGVRQPVASAPRRVAA
ncbi:MAG: hypothetical protein JWL91_1397 [Sphingomonas bacterium]|nr:hypothetical protein [Sphingomonas bacterium]